MSLGTDQPKRRKFTLTEYKLRSSFTKAMETGNSSVFKKQNQRKCSEESLASESESRSESPGERSKEVSTKDDKVSYPLSTLSLINLLILHFQRNAVQKEVSESATLKTKYEDNKVFYLHTISILYLL